MIPMSHPHRTASTVAPWGTSQPLGLLEEYLWVRRLVLLLVVVALPLLRTTKTSQGVTLASHRR